MYNRPIGSLYVQSFSAKHKLVAAYRKITGDIKSSVKIVPFVYIIIIVNGQNRGNS